MLLSHGGGRGGSICVCFGGGAEPGCWQKILVHLTALVLADPVAVALAAAVVSLLLLLPPPLLPWLWPWSWLWRLLLVLLVAPKYAPPLRLLSKCLTRRFAVSTCPVVRIPERSPSARRLHEEALHEPAAERCRTGAAEHERAGPPQLGQTVAGALSCILWTFGAPVRPARPAGPSGVARCGKGFGGMWSSVGIIFQVRLFLFSMDLGNGWTLGLQGDRKRKLQQRKGYPPHAHAQL